MDLFNRGWKKVHRIWPKLAWMLKKTFFGFSSNLFILLFALFLCSATGNRFCVRCGTWIPFEKNIQESNAQESRDLIFASVAVALLIAIQGVLGGTAFALARLPAPVFMGVLIASFHCARCRLALSGRSRRFGWASMAVGKSGFLVVIFRRGGGAGGYLVSPLLFRKPQASETICALHQHLGGLQVFGCRSGRRPTIVAAALVFFPRLYGTPDELDGAGA